MPTLPWRIGRRRPEPEAAPTASTPPASPVDRPRDQWRDLPPADRVVTGVLDRDTTAGTREFVEQLPSRWTAPAALQPLGHNISPDVVSGVVRGLTSTVGATATPLDNDAADLRWWRGRRGAQRRATAAGEPESELPVAPAEVDEDTDPPAPPVPSPVAGTPMSASRPHAAVKVNARAMIGSRMKLS